MNNTKWNEIFKKFYNEECCNRERKIRWRTLDKGNGHLSPWDETWTHFGCEPIEWEMIEYLQIQLTDENREFVLSSLKEVHVPGVVEDDIATVYGYRHDVDYI